MLLLDPAQIEELIRARQERGVDRYDEVWDGVYVMPPLANNPHQILVSRFNTILDHVIVMEGRGEVVPGANVSDRREDWEHNYRCPDVLAVLKGGQAIDCGTHFFGGPDFLVEIQSPGDDTELKIPFYSKIRVKELLIVHRDTRQLRLYRHDGNELKLVAPADGKWLTSAIVPLAFRRQVLRSGPRLEVRRTDGKADKWVF